MIGPRAARLALLVALTASTCSSSGTGAPPSPVASSEPSISLSSTASPTGQPIPLEPGPLAPGRYVAEGFAMPVSFELGEGWESVHVGRTFFDVERGEGVLSFGLMPGGVDPAAFRRELESVGLTVTPPEPGTVDELPSERLLVGPPSTETVLYETAAGTYQLQAGNTATVDLAPTRDGLLVVVTEAPEAAHEEAQIASDTVLATVSVTARAPG